MKETLGTRIYNLRKAKSMTQEEMAEILEVSPQAVSKWENDVSCPDIALLPKLARTLGVTIDALFEEEQVPEIQMLPAEKRKNINEMIFRIYVDSAKGDKVKINLPMPLVKLAVEMGMKMPQVENSPALQNLDFEQLFMMVENGVIGKLVEVESADGDIVEIVVE